MRVALLTDADVFAGTERHMLELAAGLMKLGLRPTLSCPTPSPLATAAVEHGIPVISIPKRGRLDWRAVRTLVRLLNENQIDVIHAHNGRTSLSAAIAVSLARRGALVATQHFLQPERAMRTGLAGALSACVHQWVGRRAARLIAVSEAARHEMLRRRDAAPDRITVIPHGIVEPPSSTLPTRDESRHALGVEEDVPLVLTAARLEPEKNIRSLVRAMAGVIGKMPAAQCLIAGEGSEHGRIEQEIAALGLGGRVRLLGFRSDMAALFGACDLFVLPSFAEPFGLVLLEAMSHGRAVIATRAGGPLEIVSEGETGLLVAPDDPAALEAAILTLLGDPSLGQALGDRGRRRVGERFTVARMAQATADVYRRAWEVSHG